MAEIFRLPGATRVDRPSGVTAVEQVVTNLLLTTLAATAAVPFSVSRNFDQPNPRAAAPSVSLRTHTQNALTPGALLKPFSLPEQPNPRAAQRSVSLNDLPESGLALTVAPATPNRWLTTDWPNPRGATPSIALRTHLEVRKQYYVDPTFLVAGRPTFDWPVPKGPQRGVSLLTHTQDPQTLKPAVAAPPFKPVSFPNPRGYAFPTILRSWVVSPSPTGGWTVIDDSGVAGWNPVTAGNTPSWTSVSDGNTVTWTAVDDGNGFPVNPRI